jgi:hypothetical protein
MKIQHIIPLLLLAGGLTVGAQTTNTPPHTKTMSYTLTFDESQKTIANPKEADVRAAITAHQTDMGPIFLIGPDGSKEFLRINVEDNGHFSFEYTKDGNGSGFVSVRQNFSVEEAVKVLTAYSSGAVDWKKLVDWKELKL